MARYIYNLVLFVWLLVLLVLLYLLTVVETITEWNLKFTKSFATLVSENLSEIVNRDWR